jgi:cyclase
LSIRIIPTILTDGITVVKGQKFENSRTVGSAAATARLYANRDVDELMFLDVNARNRATTIAIPLIAEFAEILDTPFSVGGGINTLDDATQCFRFGAEKIVLGTAAISNPQIITNIANVFGNQAIIVALDFKDDYSDVLLTNSGKKNADIDTYSYINDLESLGAGEILLQSCSRDGTMSGLDLRRIVNVRNETNLPVIASGGVSSTEDVYKAVSAGASAVAVGALLQFSEVTPKIISNYLRENGISTRITI